MKLAAGSAAKMAGAKISNLLGSWGFWAVIFVVGFAAWFYFKGRKKGKDKAIEEIKEEYEVKINDQQIAEIKKYGANLPAIALRLKNDIYANFPIFGRDEDAWGIVAGLSDAELSELSNVWLKNYYTEDNETLHQAISGETDFAAGRMAVLRDNILNKLQRLKIK